jgi:hypothetical protein
VLTIDVRSIVGRMMLVVQEDRAQTKAFIVSNIGRLFGDAHFVLSEKVTASRSKIRLDVFETVSKLGSGSIAPSLYLSLNARSRLRKLVLRNTSFIHKILYEYNK